MPVGVLTRSLVPDPRLRGAAAFAAGFFAFDAREGADFDPPRAFELEPDAFLFFTAIAISSQFLKPYA